MWQKIRSLPHSKLVITHTKFYSKFSSGNFDKSFCEHRSEKPPVDILDLILSLLFTCCGWSNSGYFTKRMKNSIFWFAKAKQCCYYAELHLGLKVLTPLQNLSKREELCFVSVLFWITTRGGVNTFKPKCTYADELISWISNAGSKNHRKILNFKQNMYQIFGVTQNSLGNLSHFWDSLRLTEPHWDSLRLIETHWDSLRLIETHWDSQWLTKLIKTLQH